MLKKMSYAAFCLFIFNSLIAQAQISEKAIHFKEVGKIASFPWAPGRYSNVNNNFKYDVFYYVPEKLQNKSDSSALIFMHGGGASTMDRAGSIDVVKVYLRDFVKLADELGFILVMPSANGLNWGAHTRGLLRDLGDLMRKELLIDPNKLGVSGHSMGAMGITRAYNWVADEFSFFMPLAGGMDLGAPTTDPEINKKIEYTLNKSFNISYTHIQGLNDHFKIFVAKCQDQLKRTKELESKYKVKSKLDMIFFSGGHNYDYSLVKTNLSKLLNVSRDLYQKELWGTTHTVQKTVTENAIAFDYDQESRYFWVEVLESDTSVDERFYFHAKIVDNKITIDSERLPLKSKKLRIYLHRSMVDFSSDVKVFLNGKLVATRLAGAGTLRNYDLRDPAFIFEDHLDIALPNTENVIPSIKVLPNKTEVNPLEKISKDDVVKVNLEEKKPALKSDLKKNSTTEILKKKKKGLNGRFKKVYKKNS